MKSERKHERTTDCAGACKDFSVYSECDGEPVPDFEWHDLTYI